MSHGYHSLSLLLFRCSFFSLLLVDSWRRQQRKKGGNSVGWVFLFLGLFMLLNVVVKVATTELALTNKRIIAKFGFIRRSTVELRLEKVESISINQGLLGRLLGYGTVVVKGTGGTGTPIPSIKKPLDFRRIVNNFLEEKETTAQ
jgi:uncharacterized membrane protein YdbT with pleckstrin-like domain